MHAMFDSDDGWPPHEQTHRGELHPAARSARKHPYAAARPLVSTTPVLFWDVDTQYDFMRDGTTDGTISPNDPNDTYVGTLPVPGARAIERNLETLTIAADMFGIRKINTGDSHTAYSAELSDTPDFTATYPAHCLRGSIGEEFIPATRPKNPYIIDWDQPRVASQRVYESRELIIRKDATDAFIGNPHTGRIIDLLQPQRAIVYGVVAEICVDKAVRGLCARVPEVYVVRDAIKELPGTDIEQLYRSLDMYGAKIITTEDAIRIAATSREEVLQ
jgi:nicotinamidase-related amidase